MTQMYVANATEQLQNFHYSIPEHAQRRTIQIPPHRQSALPDDMSNEDIEAVIKQHRVYGFLSVDEINNSRTIRRFTGLCYSLGRPVASIKIDILLRANHQVLLDQGEENRKKTAIASNEALARTVRDANERNITTDYAIKEMSVQQDIKDGDDFVKSEAVSEDYKLEQRADVLPSRTRRRK